MGKKITQKITQEIIQEELQQAWDVVSDYLNNHKELTFFVDPWDSKGRNRYTLSFYADEQEVRIVSATRKWKK